MTVADGSTHSGYAAPSAAEFRLAMRQLAGGVSVITVGRGSDRTGLTVTSVASLSADPPTIVFCLAKNSSSWDLLIRNRVFAVNFIDARSKHLADRFAGRGGEKGSERYSGTEWTSLVTGAAVLPDAIAALDCELDDLIDRGPNGIVIGRVVGVRVNADDPTPRALTYWRGEYLALGA